MAGAVVFGITDWLDGYIAKKYPSQRSTLGSWLDPAADKMLVAALALPLGIDGLLPLPLVSLLFLKDVSIVVALRLAVSPDTPLVDLRGRGDRIEIQPNAVSKLNTALTFTMLAAALARPIYGFPDDLLFDQLCCGVMTTTVLSGLSYGFKAGVSEAPKYWRGS